MHDVNERVAVVLLRQILARKNVRKLKKKRGFCTTTEKAAVCVCVCV